MSCCNRYFFFSEYNQKMYRNHKSMPKPVPPVGADSYPDSYVSGNNTGGRFGVLVSLVISTKLRLAWLGPFSIWNSIDFDRYSI